VLAPIPFSSSICLVAEALRLYGTAEQKARYLPRLASGELIGAFAAAEGPSWELDAPDARFAGGRLTGRKLPVADGTIAGLLIVTARAADGALRLLSVDADQPGVARRPVKTIDELRRHAVIEFADAAAEPLAAPDGAKALARLLDGAAVYGAFEQVGGADVCLEMARAYAMERKTFGRLIGSYQALKHRMADMFAKNELARSNAYGAAWALAQEAPELPLLAGAARLSGIEALNFGSTENLQIHGGIGYTFEANCHFYYRRARLLADALGGRGAWSDRVVEALLAA
jgi:acyl-CoA dehydrogenase